MTIMFNLMTRLLTMTTFSFHCSEYGRSKGSLRGPVDSETFRPRRSCQQSLCGGTEDTGGEDGYPQPELGV